MAVEDFKLPSADRKEIKQAKTVASQRTETKKDKKKTDDDKSEPMMVEKKQFDKPND